MAAAARRVDLGAEAREDRAAFRCRPVGCVTRRWRQVLCAAVVPCLVVASGLSAVPATAAPVGSPTPVGGKPQMASLKLKVAAQVKIDAPQQVYVHPVAQ